MKKKLRAQIRTFAAQLISDESNLDTVDLKDRVRTLYEQITLLDYLESQIEDDGVRSKTQALDSKSFREENWFKEPEPVPQPENKEELIEPLMEKIKDIVAQMPEESNQVDALLEEVLPQAKYAKNDLEEFAASYQQTPTFERKEPTKGGELPKVTHQLIPDIAAPGEKPKSLNDSVPQGLQIGLNDRLAFIKHLFDGSAEDYTRVLSQLSTMKTYDEATIFIKGTVKPDYNHWAEKDEFAGRFMSILEKRFN